MADRLTSFKSDPDLVMESRLSLPELPLHSELQLYCIIKEGLENICRHAQAHMVELFSLTMPENIVVYIEDNGIGFDTASPTSGFGLRGMQERAQSRGGSMKGDSAPGQGTRSEITVPYD